MRKLFFVLMLCSFFATPAAFAESTFPTNARLGAMVQFKYPYMKIGKQTYRLSPGARIYDQWNRILLPGAVPASATVVFTIDLAGALAKVWILSASEVEKLKGTVKPSNHTKESG